MCYFTRGGRGDEAVVFFVFFCLGDEDGGGWKWVKMCGLMDGLNTSKRSSV